LTIPELLGNTRKGNTIGQYGHGPKGVIIMKMSTMGWISWSLVVVGAINWGLVGLWNINLVESLFGYGGLTNIVYMLVGLSGLYMLWGAMSMKK